MTNPDARLVHRLTLAFAALLVGALLLPRLVRDPGGGFAAATTAALMFIVLAALAALLALSILVIAWRRREHLSPSTRLVSVAPAVAVLGTAAWFWARVLE